VALFETATRRVSVLNSASNREDRETNN